MRYVILLSSEQTYDGQAERTDAATNITWHPGKRPTDRAAETTAELSWGLSRARDDGLL